METIFYIFISAAIAYLIEENRHMRTSINNLENKFIELLAKMSKRRDDR